jgi:hypothetical protein
MHTFFQVNHQEVKIDFKSALKQSAQKQEDIKKALTFL